MRRSICGPSSRCWGDKRSFKPLKYDEDCKARWGDPAELCILRDFNGGGYKERMFFFTLECIV